MTARFHFKASSLAYTLTAVFLSHACIQNIVTAATTAAWMGSIEMKLDIEGTDYSRHETQTWTLTGGAPTMSGAIALYPATWHYTGSGKKTISSEDAALGATQRNYTWTVDISRDVQLAIFVRASDHKQTIHQWTAALNLPNAIPVSSDTTVSRGVPPPTGRTTAYAEQWNFGWIEGDPASAEVSGTTTLAASQLAAPVRFDGALPAAACTWHFSQQGNLSSAPSAKLETPAAMTNQPTTNVTISALAPISAVQGARNVSITARAPGAHWQNGVTQVNFGSGITVSSLNATQPDYASLVLNVDTSATPGKRTVTFFTRTGSGVEQATWADGFTVEPVQDPTQFTARQTGDGQVQLSWNSVPHAYAYLVFGPGTAANGTKVQLQTPDPWTYTLTGIPTGPQEWRVTSWYDPDGSRTKQSSWPKASTTVIPYQGRYRILFNGIRVNHQTFHDVVSPNGSGDDVYAAASVQVGTRNSANAATPLTLGSGSIVKTLIHGNAPDSNQVVGSSFGSGGAQAQVRAGTATASGGLTNGDTFPAGQDPSTNSAVPVSGSFPFLIWEGDLTYGKDAVFVVPSLWKMTTGDTCVYEYWIQNYANGSYYNERQPASLRDHLANADLSPIIGPDCFPCFTTTNLISGSVVPLGAGTNCSCTPRTDRPIGIVPGDANFAPSMAYYRGSAIVVTLEAIEKALTAAQGSGGTAGFITLHLADTAGSEFGGDYDLFFRVERAPTAVASAPPNVSTTVAASAIPITTVTPSSGQQWDDRLVVTFEAPGAHFVQGRTTLDLGAGVTPVAIPPYQAVDVASPTKMLATLQIAGNAAPGPRTVKITTGSEVAAQTNGFTINARDVHDVFQIAPSSASASQQNVAITLMRPSPWPRDYFALQGSALNFGPGISVVSFEQVISDDYLAHAKAILNVAPNAASGPRTITVKRAGSPDDVFPGAFAVTAGSGSPGTGSGPVNTHPKTAAPEANTSTTPKPVH